MGEREPNIIAVSDVHLGYRKRVRINKWDDNSESKKFGTFLQWILDEADITDFVLLGDIMDFWRRKDRDIILENKDILSKINSIAQKANVHYVVGNHDYYVLKLKDIYPKYYPFDVEKNIALDGFYFIHGYQLEVFNWEPLRVNDYEKFCERFCSCENCLGSLSTWLWKTFKKRSLKTMMKSTQKRKDELDLVVELAKSDGKELFLGMPRNDKLIFGHTHRPFLTEDKLVANTGSWVNEEPNRNTYIEIKNDNMFLRHWDR